MHSHKHTHTNTQTHTHTHIHTHIHTYIHTHKHTHVLFSIGIILFFNTILAVMIEHIKDTGIIINILTQSDIITIAITQ